MAWETRNGRKYFYRSVRVGGRVRKQYFGAGPIGLLAAKLHDQQQQERAELRAVKQAFIGQFEVIDRLVENVLDTAKTVLDAALYGRGFYRHNRREWRGRKRWPKALRPAPGIACESIEDLKELIRRADAYDDEVRTELVNFPQSNSKFWANCVACIDRAEAALITACSQNNATLIGLIRRQLHEEKRQLEGRADTQIEAQLIAAIGICSVAVHHAKAILECIEPTHRMLCKLAQSRYDRLCRRYDYAVQLLHKSRQLRG